MYLFISIYRFLIEFYYLCGLYQIELIMLPLYLVTYTLTPYTQGWGEEQLKMYIATAIEHATHLMGLITSEKTPQVVIRKEPHLYAQIIVSVSFGKAKAAHLDPVAKALGDLIANELPECEVRTQFKKLELH